MVKSFLSAYSILCYLSPFLGPSNSLLTLMQPGKVEGRVAGGPERRGTVACPELLWVGQVPGVQYWDPLGFPKYPLCLSLCVVMGQECEYQ